MSKDSSEEFRRVSTLVDLLRFRASHQPDGIAYHFLSEGEAETGIFTFGDLDRAARAVATLLQGLNTQGKPVLLLYPPGLEYVAAFFGCVYAGAIAVPAYPPRPNRSLERLQTIIHNAEAQIALTHSDVLRGLERRFEECADLKKLHWLATDNLDDSLANSWIDPNITADTLALLQYTSGSTGNPKGVMVSHDNLIHNSARIYELFGHSEKTIGMSWLPPYHDMGLVGGILQTLYIGVPVVLMPPIAFLQKPLRWLQVISRYRVTTSGGPNFAYDLCVQKTTPEQRLDLDLSSWEIAFSGAEPVRAETLQRFTEAFAPAGFKSEAFYPCYGMAETTLIVTGGDRQKPPKISTVDEDAMRVHQVANGGTDGQTVVSCGSAPIDQGLRIVNPETRVLCADNQVGEIWVAASGSVTQGYWHLPQQTEETFQAYTREGTGPFLRTGDLGFLQAGELFVTGRRKELIIIRGRNYYPKDIETTVESAHAALRPGAGAAFSITIKGQERLVVVQEVERTHLRNLDADTIVNAVRRAIAEQYDLQIYGLQLLKTGSLPKTSSGKIQRLQCRAGYLDHQLAAVHSWQLDPREGGAAIDWHDRPSPDKSTQLSEETLAKEESAPIGLTPDLQSAEAIKRWLSAWLAQQLQLPITEIDVTRPFAEYGLDSVTAVELTEALRTETGRSLSPTLAYEYPTIEAVATYLGTQMGHSPSQVAAAPKQTTNEEDLTELLNELEDLSEAEVQELLGQQER